MTTATQRRTEAQLRRRRRRHLAIEVDRAVAELALGVGPHDRVLRGLNRRLEPRVRGASVRAG